MDSLTRKPHAISINREKKAKKIESLIEIEKPLKNGFKILEIGTGSGGIAAYFAQHGSLTLDVSAVDVIDSRDDHAGYKFALIQGTTLPFADASFDIVISNHVVEHVGNTQDQLHHLQEMKRVLKSDGLAYLAVPNRWMIVEPHYQVWFLSWLPGKFRSGYLNWRKGISFYDCEPLTKSKTEQLLQQSGFIYLNRCIEAVHLFLNNEGSQLGLLMKFLRFIPDWLLYALRGIIPTLIYTLRKTAAK